MKKDSYLGKGYSIFFACIVLILIFSSSFRVEINLFEEKAKIKIQLVEVNQSVVTVGLMVVSCLLGLPSDEIAHKIATLLGYKKEED